MNKTTTNNDPNGHEIEGTDIQITLELDNLSFSELSDDEKIDIVAARILKQFKPAFEALAK